MLARSHHGRLSDATRVSGTVSVLAVCPFGLRRCRFPRTMRRTRHHLNSSGAQSLHVSHFAVVGIRNRPSGAASSSNDSDSSRLPESAGFEEAVEAGNNLLMVARALVTDRLLLLIPAWAYVACLVLAAALTRVS